MRRSNMLNGHNFGLAGLLNNGLTTMFDLQGYEASILSGALLTIQVAVLSLLLAVVLGMAGALAKMAPYRFARSIATLYTTIIRGIPDLVLMMLIFSVDKFFLTIVFTL